MRAIAIVDGEHYASVVRHALAELPYEFAAAVLVGGQEKLRGGEDYGVPLVADVEAAIDAYAPDVVVDLSDEPVLGPPDRLALASRVLARGVPYVGADFRFDPPERMPFELPSIAVVGTGKRVGKTAVTGHLARVLAEDLDVVVVAMGRGGPTDPEVVTVPPTVDALVELSRSGRHAASDHLETAALVGVATVGCRRCGGGLAGAVATSNVGDGARIAAALDPDLVLFDGSGAALPPIAADRTVVVVGAHQDPAVAVGYLNTYRLLVADLVVVTMAERRLVVGGRARTACWPLFARAYRSSRPSSDRDRSWTSAVGRSRTSALLPSTHTRIFDITSRSCTERASCTCRAISRTVRPSTTSSASVSAEVYLVELKAAAIDVVAEAALEKGAEVVLAANDVVPIAGEPDLDELLLGMAKFQR